MGRLTANGARLLETGAGERILRLAVRSLYRDEVRRPVFRTARLVTDAFVRGGNRHGTSDRLDLERKLFAIALLDTIDNITGKRAVSREFMEHASLLWARALLGIGRSPDAGSARERFKEEHGVDPPWILVVAPTGECNLRCPGCYAGPSTAGRSMPFPELDRLIDEAKRLWGIKVVVFSGGEPLMYRSESKDVLDVIERHPDLLSLIFTNGTLVPAWSG